MSRVPGAWCFAVSVAVLLLSMPLCTAAQGGRSRTITLPGTYTVLGVSGGHTIFKRADGTLFSLEPKSGEVTPVAAGMKYRKIKDGTEEVTILEIDQKGNVLQKNTQGVAFYLSRKTGSRVFVKWPK